jgi:DNA-directed RNA polymerase subunit RPC12/RpoP
MPAIESDSELHFQIMSEQPDCCGRCGRRLELIELTEMEGERVFWSRCSDCQREILVLED